MFYLSLVFEGRTHFKKLLVVMLVGMMMFFTMGLNLYAAVPDHLSQPAQRSIYSDEPTLTERAAQMPLPDVMAQAQNSFPLTSYAVWFSSDSSYTFDVAWGDVDGDGDLDLAAGNIGANKLYLNEDGMLQMVADWESEAVTLTYSVAWGDVDGDGDLDLATGNDGVNRLYLNQGGELQTAMTITKISDDSDDTRSVAWGDVNGDGYLDLAVGNFGAPNKIYLNNNGMLEETASWESADSDDTRSLAWGDADGDGDLDLAAGNGGVNRIYLNQDGTLQTTASWQSDENDDTYSVVWGDINNDGWFELAVGNESAPNKVYLNQNGVLQTAAGWQTAEVDDTSGVAFGDVNGDGYLDLAVSNDGVSNVVHLNDNGTLQSNAAWRSDDRDYTFDVAWGDVDGDGDLDLAIAEEDANKIYLNENGVLQTESTWESDDAVNTKSVAWGDMDGDGDLDLAAANDGSNKVYLNENGTLNTTAVWESADSDLTWSIAWGDMDGDGDLDLAAGNHGNNKVYLNDNGSLQPMAVWQSADDDITWSVAWGDMDGDGYLDLATGNAATDKIYLNGGLNNNGMLLTNADWQSNSNKITHSIVWGDVDGDGDLDLAAGMFEVSNLLYLNENGMLQSSPAWESGDDEFTWSIAWGDVDGDGDLDLAVGNYRDSNKIYLNHDGTLQTNADNPLYLSDGDSTQHVVWGDVDGDGDADLATGNDFTTNRIYLNVNSTIQTVGDNTWRSDSINDARSFAWGDVDGDGDLDLAVGSNSGANQLYINGRGSNTLPTNAPYLTVSRPIAAAAADFYAPPEIVSDDIIPIAYTLFDYESNEVGEIRAEYSLGGNKWFPAVAAANTITNNLETSPWPIGTEHVFYWDTFASGFFGQSNYVTFRLIVQPQSAMPPSGDNHLYLNQTPFPIQRPYASAATFPFRVRGTQVQVVNEGDLQPVQGAVVYKSTAGLLAEPMSNEQTGDPFRTAADGYLSGRGELTFGDRLIALKPVATPSEITFTNKISFYHTSAAVTATSLDLFTVENPGVQQLQTSSDNQLMLLNLSVSLEWDASKDPDYLSRLEQDIKRTSEILFDLSNGRIALGDVTVYQNKEQWEEADIIIFASNTQRPNANLGGIVNDFMSDQDSNGEPIPFAFIPGKIRMPAKWNRYGNPFGTIGEDWPRVLAHEIGHYTLFMIDNYLGLDELNNLLVIDCQGSAMTDAYRPDYSEFLTSSQWALDPQCQQSVAQRATGRSDWETIGLYYGSFLSQDVDGNPPVNNGPATLPLAVTQVMFSDVQDTNKVLLDAPFFYLSNETDETLAIGRGRATSYLFQDQNTPSLEDDVLVPLGSPVGPLLEARGAHVGDTICVYDYSNDIPRTGCLEDIDNFSATLKLFNLTTDWTPDILVEPLVELSDDDTNNNRLQITIEQGGNNPLEVQVYPVYRPTADVKALVDTVTPIDGKYTAIFNFPLTVLSGHVRVYEVGSNPRKEIIIPFSITPKWEGNSFSGWGGNTITGWDGNSFSAWGGNSFSAWGGNSFSAWGGNSFSAWGAPVVSPDGQVTLFDTDNIIGNGSRADETPSAIMQAIQNPSYLPAWYTTVGQAYRYSTDGSAENNDLVILFRYLEREVPPGNEPTLAIYYLAEQATEWRKLTTQIDVERNLATAAMQGVGTYALISTIELSFDKGWNLFGYPLQETRQVSSALQSIDGYYSAVYGYDTVNESWLLYDPTISSQHPEFAPIVNTLTELQFSDGYWLYATSTITGYLAVEETARQTLTNDQVPPATYFGYILDEQFTVGDTLLAKIDDVICGVTTLQMIDGRLGYVIQVEAGDDRCGESGRIIQLAIDGVTLANQPGWNSEQANFVNLSKTAVYTIYVPIVLDRD